MQRCLNPLSILIISFLLQIVSLHALKLSAGDSLHFKTHAQYIFVLDSGTFNVKRNRYQGLVPAICRYKGKHSLASSSATNNDMTWPDPKSAPKLDFDEDYYSVLEVSPTIDSKSLKKEYYKLVFKYHPDNKQLDSEKALCNKQMMVINAAYKVLKDEALREAYDKKRKMGFTGAKAAVKSASRSTASTTTTSTSAKTSSASTSNRYERQSRYYRNENTNTYKSGTNVSPPVESFDDILSDIWSDLRNGGGSTLMDDIMTFLEDQVKLSSVSKYTTSSFSKDIRPVDELITEINVLENALKNLHVHKGELLEKCLTCKRLLQEGKQVASSNQKSLKDIEESLKNEEDLKANEARLNYAEKQIRKIEDQLRVAKERLQEAYKAKDNSSTQRNDKAASVTRESQQNSKRSQNMDDPIELELKKLKDKMGLR